MEAAAAEVERNFKYFGYSYLSSPEAAIPPVALTFYSFRVMVITGGLLLLVLVVAIPLRASAVAAGSKKAGCSGAGMLSIALVWICSQSGWIICRSGTPAVGHSGTLCLPVLPYRIFRRRPSN